jgi:hypothetical protein
MEDAIAKKQLARIIIPSEISNGGIMLESAVKCEGNEVLFLATARLMRAVSRIVVGDIEKDAALAKLDDLAEAYGNALCTIRSVACEVINDAIGMFEDGKAEPPRRVRFSCILRGQRVDIQVDPYQEIGKGTGRMYLVLSERSEAEEAEQRGNKTEEP